MKKPVRVSQFVSTNHKIETVSDAIGKSNLPTFNNSWSTNLEMAIYERKEGKLA